MVLSSRLKVPFELRGLGLPENVVLLVRLLAITLLATWHVQQIQTPFLPFLSIFDILPGEVWRTAIQAVLIVACLAILFTRRIRTASLFAGLALLAAVASSRAYYGNNKTFVALLLILAALSHKSGTPWLLRAQVALVYFGAGLNKILDPHWQSGQFFHFWAGERLANPLYLWLDSVLPALVTAKAFCWSTIGIELVLAVLMLLPALAMTSIWISALFQAALLLFTGDTFNLFHYAMQASLLAFVTWPKEPVTVIWDGMCGFCAKSKAWMERFDFDRVLHWAPFQSGIGSRWGLPPDQLEKHMYSVSDDAVRKGYDAWRAMVVWLPAFWYAALLALIFAATANGRRVVTIALLLLLTPLSNRIGEAVYDWVARNRNRLSGGSCELPGPPSSVHRSGIPDAGGRA